MLNWSLLKHPANWVIVLLMLVIAGAAGHLALAYFGAESSTPTDDGQFVPSGPNRMQLAESVLG